LLENDNIEDYQLAQMMGSYFSQIFIHPGRLAIIMVPLADGYWSHKDIALVTWNKKGREMGNIIQETKKSILKTFVEQLHMFSNFYD
jgi:hypothetical protein